jgi:Rrf2 family protein
VYISAKSDYAMRALLVLATETEGRPMKAESVATSQSMPLNFVENILAELKRSGLVLSQRGASGGFRLARPASSITVADVIRAVDGPLAEVRGESPDAIDYVGPAEHLRTVWVATRASLRTVLEHVSLADIVAGELPAAITDLTADPEAWLRR